VAHSTSYDLYNPNGQSQIEDKVPSQSERLVTF
jgi:hypothetical protein